MKIWISIIVVIVLSAIAVFAWRSSSYDSHAGSNPGWTPPPPVVEVAPVQRGNVVRTLHALGTLRANESVIVRPEIPGRIIAIHFKEGQAVTAGELLIELDASVYAAQVKEKTADRRLAELAFNRADKLVHQHAAPIEDRDTALAQLQADDAALQLANANLKKNRLRAPFDGVIGLRRVSVGDFVIAGQDLVSLVELDPIKVDFRIGEVNLSRLAPGQSVNVAVNAFPKQQFVGTVYAIEPQIDVNGRSILIRARLPNKNLLLRPGLFARVDLIVDQAANALLVTEDAIVPRGDQHFVYRLVGEKAILTEVTLGERKNTLVEVAEGLSAQDVVITAGQLKLRDGIVVRTIKTDEAEAIGASSKLPPPTT